MARSFAVLLVTIVAVLLQPTLGAQQRPEDLFASEGIPPLALPAAPVVFDTAEGQRIRVVVVTTGLSHPWGLAFLPNGDMLVTERSGSLRLIRDGVLDPTPIPGVPEVFTGALLAGLMDVALHPQFAQNRFVYLTYSKPTRDGSTVALARGRFDGNVMSEVRDIFVADADGGDELTGGGGASRLAFGPDGMLYMTVGGAIEAKGSGKSAQDPASHIGKLLRLHDDGSAPDDNPFVDNAGYKAEIYAMGHRNQLGLAFHPHTGALWASEHGPMGGDEVNVILPGRNYGWPVVSYSREYYGSRVSERPWREDMEPPAIVWIPSIAPSGLQFYTGDRFPAWEGDLFVGSAMTGRVRRTGHVERIGFNQEGQEQRREWLLADLKQRIRDVRQGPDGLLYVLTEEDEAAVLRIEPVE